MNRKTLLAALLLILPALACGTTASPTRVVITQEVVIPNAAVTTPPAQAGSNVFVTSGPSATTTPTGTPPATLTASPTAITTGPVATFIKNANCRQGPGTSYEVVTSFLAGQTVEIVGRNPDFDNTWWLVKIPDSNDKCWVSLVTAQAYGDFDEIPTVIP